MHTQHLHLVIESNLNLLLNSELVLHARITCNSTKQYFGYN